MKTTQDTSLKQLAIPYIASFIGCLIVTVGMNAFFIPHHLLSSGIGGVAIMFYFAVGLPVGVGIFALNIPIMIACYKFMGRQYTILSIVGTAIFGMTLLTGSQSSMWLRCSAVMDFIA